MALETIHEHPIAATANNMVESPPPPLVPFMVCSYDMDNIFFGANVRMGESIRDLVEWIWPSGGREDGSLHPEFINRAKRFYSSPETIWEPIRLGNAGGKVWYLLQHDNYRDLVVNRFLFLDTILRRLWGRIKADQSNNKTRKSEISKLEKCLQPLDGISRIAQKPLGGYDVRAYAHDAWVLIEIPTFATVETGADGVNVTEDRRRRTLVHIILHELAHVAGYWEHNDAHATCVSWLTRYLDPGF